jgi:hypothetical protein
LNKDETFCLTIKKSLGPTPGNLCNQNFVINYFKAADNVYSTNVSMLSGAWSGSSYQVNINPINHPVTFPKFVAVSSCSNSGLNLLSAWYDGSGDCVTPGNGNIYYKESPGNSMSFKTTGVIDMHGASPAAYPNPVTDRLYLSGMSKGTKAEYKLLDMSGRVLKQGSYSAAGIETGFLSPGLYMLQTSKNGKTYSLKFTKQ